MKPSPYAEGSSRCVRIARLAGTAVLAALCVSAAPADPSGHDGMAHGIYGNVRESRATADLGGIEIRLGAREIETVLCEGWCNRSYTTAYTVRDGVIRYAVPDEVIDQMGRISTETIPVELRRSGRNVRATVPGYLDGAVLKPLRKPYGLAIARQTNRTL